MVRRVEHAARHAEILQTFGRLSKSAATSPVATPYLASASISREYFESETDDDSALRSRRRASGGWAQDGPPPQLTTGQMVDNEQRRRAHIGWTTHSHPYTFAHPRGPAQQDDSPSPRSIDEELPVSVRVPGPYMTPTTSPFLGGLSTLNIHSAQPSRAPSPIMLPPPATRPGSPGDDFYRRRGGDSPPYTSRKRRSSADGEPYRYGYNTAPLLFTTHVSCQCSCVSTHLFLSSGSAITRTRDPLTVPRALLSVLYSWSHDTCPLQWA